MVYIDDMKAEFGRMKMCHMVADSTEELLAMVDKIGVHRKWIQHPGTLNEHFDICLQKKVRALDYGAKEITWRGYAQMIEERCKKAGVHFALASKTIAVPPVDER